MRILKGVTHNVSRRKCSVLIKGEWGLILQFSLQLICILTSVCNSVCKLVIVYSRARFFLFLINLMYFQHLLNKIRLKQTIIPVAMNQPH